MERKPESSRTVVAALWIGSVSPLALTSCDDGGGRTEPTPRAAPGAEEVCPEHARYTTNGAGQASCVFEDIALPDASDVAAYCHWLEFGTIGFHWTETPATAAFECPAGSSYSTNGQGLGFCIFAGLDLPNADNLAAACDRLDEGVVGYTWEICPEEARYATNDWGSGFCVFDDLALPNADDVSPYCLYLEDGYIGFSWTESAQTAGYECPEGARLATNGAGTGFCLFEDLWLPPNEGLGPYCNWLDYGYIGYSWALEPWLEFDDETTQRLELSTVSLSDAQEKDIAVGDLDGDGWDDLVVVRKTPFSVAGPDADVLLMNEQGVLRDRTVQLAPEFTQNLTDARDVVIVDIDGDGWLDVLIVNTFGDLPTIYINMGNDAAGTWQGLIEEPDRIPALDPGLIDYCAADVGDLDGDGAPDMFFANYGGDDVLLMNDGAGSFADETATRLGLLASSGFATSAELRDMDADGDLDIVEVYANQNRLLFNDGTGSFVREQSLPQTASYMFAVGDFDDDPLLDQYVVQDGQDRINYTIDAIANDRIVTQARTLYDSPRTAGFGGNAHLADLDGDGDLDIGVGPIDVDIANCGTSGPLALLRNPDDGFFYDPWPPGADENFHLDPHDFVFTDVNKDGKPDIFMGLCTGWRVFIQK